MANTVRDAEKEAFWRDVVRRQVGSGTAVKEFCRREGLAESSFYAWRRIVVQRDDRKTTPAAKKAKRQKTTPTFVPIIATGRMYNRDEIVLELGGGRKLRLDAEISATRLAAIVHAIESEATS
jgi:transposase-like protein